MLTFLVLYLGLYFFIFFYFFLFLNIIFSNSLSLTNPLSLIIKFIKQYSAYSYLFAFLSLSLAGLPPFFLFYPKFYILIELGRQVNVLIQVLLLIFFFFSTIFYLQIFNTTTLNQPINVKFLNSLRNVKHQPTNTNFFYYNFSYHFFMFLFFNFFSFIFFPDLFLIIYSWV